MTLSDLGACVSSSANSKRTAPAPVSPVQSKEQTYNVRSVIGRPMERCASNTSTFSFNQDICRICHCEGDAESPLIAPCYCAGSLRYVHQSCLQQWIKSSDTKSCELCKFNFIMHSKIKPFNKWERLDMSGMEQRKIACSVTFHFVAIICVVWSLSVLIERTTEEVQEGTLEWPFWTKLIVVAIGFTGGLVFMYVQCKMYVQLCRRWRAFNRVIYVQNAPEKVPLSEREREARRDPGPQTGVKEACSDTHENDKSLMGVSIIMGTSNHDLNPPTTTLSTPLSTPTSFSIPSPFTLTQTSTSSTTTTSAATPPGAVWTDTQPGFTGVLSGIRHSRSTPHQPTEFKDRPSDRSTFESPIVYEGKCNHGSMEELSSQALAQSDRQPFRKSSSHSTCLEKGVERGLAAGERGLGTGERGLVGSERGLVASERGLGTGERGLVASERGLGGSERERGLGAGERRVSGGERSILGGERGSIGGVERRLVSGGVKRGSVGSTERGLGGGVDRGLVSGGVDRGLGGSTERGLINSGSIERGSIGGLLGGGVERGIIIGGVGSGMVANGNIERGIVTPHDFYDNYGGAMTDTLLTSNRRGEIKVEPRMIHTPNLSLQCRTEGGVDAHEVETLHLDNM